MAISTRMITNAAIFAVLNPMIWLAPPTISDMGRAIRWKLITAPPIAMARTKAAMKNCVMEDEDNIRTARSVCLLTCSYSSM